MSEPAILLDRLSKSYGETEAVRDLSLTIAPGTIFGFLGANGAGKTTTIRMLCGLVHPTGGSAQIAGLDVWRERHQARAQFGYVAQRFSLYRDLTVEENLKLALVRDRDFKPLFERIEDLFPFLKDRLGQKAGTLSGGEQKMLLVARALICKPKLILIDEITEGMQPSVIERLVGILSRERDTAGTTMLLVEQHVAFAFAVASRYAVLELGEIPAAGATADASASATVSRFLSL